MTEVLHYKGKLITELTREELEEAFKEMVRKHIQEKHDKIDFMTKVIYGHEMKEPT